MHISCKLCSKVNMVFKLTDVSPTCLDLRSCAGTHFSVQKYRGLSGYWVAYYFTDSYQYLSPVSTYQVSYFSIQLQLPACYQQHWVTVKPTSKQVKVWSQHLDEFWRQLLWFKIWCFQYLGFFVGCPMSNTGGPWALGKPACPQHRLCDENRGVWAGQSDHGSQGQQA